MISFKDFDPTNLMVRRDGPFVELMQHLDIAVTKKVSVNTLSALNPELREQLIVEVSKDMIKELWNHVYGDIQEDLMKITYKFCLPEQMLIKEVKDAVKDLLNKIQENKNECP